jgi:hypothetical protein
MCIALISAIFVFELILFAIVFLLIRLRHPFGARVTAWSIAGALVLFLASFGFLLFLGIHYRCG